MQRLPLFPGSRILLACCLVASPVFAQTDAPPPPASQADMPPPPPDGPRRGGPDRRAEMMQHHLNLTPDQTTQVKGILETERSKMEVLRGNNSLSQDDRRSQMMTIHSDSESKIRALLTPDQATKYDAMQAHMREHHRGPEGGPPPPPPGGPGEP